MAVEPGPTWRQVRSRIANTRRHHPDADVSEDQRDLRVALLEEEIQRVANEAPAPTPEQLERLRSLLAPAAPAASDKAA
ncbi:hypothetical protein [Streptomyces sp. NRRL F-5122]|uniref:hypothetical protein n=1 Tax=Streptomyces sp. NRRL F-5122 TaxID=1609098 RepID=UPI00131B8E47|nr:hypothetical protein [Streptomyces sp. NRRL F-5122]